MFEITVFRGHIASFCCDDGPLSGIKPLFPGSLRGGAGEGFEEVLDPITPGLHILAGEYRELLDPFLNNIL
jgi:hypothetical protein